MEISTDLYVTQLKAQRNALADEVALAIAQCHHLMKENAKLKELSDKQAVLLDEADKIMRDMAKEKDVPRGKKVRTLNVKNLIGINTHDVGNITAGNFDDHSFERQTNARMELKRRVDAENMRLPTGKKPGRKAKTQMATLNGEASVNISVAPGRPLDFPSQ